MNCGYSCKLRTKHLNEMCVLMLCKKGQWHNSKVACFQVIGHRVNLMETNNSKKISDFLGPFIFMTAKNILLFNF